MISDYIALIFFVIAMVASPGPANVILFALGCTQNFRKSIPFILSVALSKQLIIWPIGFSLFLINDLTKQYSSIMMLLSVLFISWIGYKIIFMELSIKDKSNVWVPRFYHGLVVHPLNPKAWLMVTLAFTAFQSQGVSVETIPNIAMIFLLIQLIFHSAWFWFGSLIRKANLSEKNSRIVKIALLMSLFVSIVFSYY
ncbi:LysE family transporter [Paracoccaceae bacterium]|nr:LysE family transporter [Paracoccaceae bacterium]